MEEGLDLFEIWRIIVKRWYLLLVLPFLTAGVLYFYSYDNYTPVYRASATLMVTRPSDSAYTSSGEVHLHRTLVSTYREIALSRRILDLAATDDMIPYSGNQLRGMLQVEGVGETELIEISVTDRDPVLASYIANMVSRVFMDQIGVVIRGAHVTILDEAPVPGGPSNSPAGAAVNIAFIVGLVAAVGLAFLIDYLDRSIKDRDEAERILGIPVLGIVPKVPGNNQVAVKGRSPQAESMRTLRTNLQFASADKQMRRILVTGPDPGCGKTTISANLALTLAQSGDLVLLVDADMRRPMQQRIFNVNKEPGLSSLIYYDGLDLSKVVRNSGRDNLKIIPCGPIPPYPSEMLSSQRMKDLVKRFSDQFDYIVFDSPPVLAVTDATVLSKLVDGTLLVLNQGQVRRDAALDALKQLQMVQANVVGSVINKMPTSSAYYNGYYDYYGADLKNGSRENKKRSARRKAG